MNVQVSAPADKEKSISQIPVYQRAESVVFAAGSVLMTAALGSNILQVANEGLNDANGYGVLTTSLGAAALGYCAVTAHKQTQAYKKATEEERNAPDTLPRRIFVRDMRSIGWGGASVLSAELAVGAMLKSAEASTTGELAVGLGVTAISTLIGVKSAKNFKSSLRKRKSLIQQRKALLPDNRDTVFVSPEYRSQLDELSKSLVTTDRFQSL